MTNKRGLTAKERINEAIKHLKRLNNTEKSVFIYRISGMNDFALDFGMITYNEWEQNFDRLVEMGL